MVRLGDASETVSAVQAPWSPEQVKALHERQLFTGLHSYYCQCGDILRPQADGWFCRECNRVTQTWAHDFDFERWWTW